MRKAFLVLSLVLIASTAMAELQNIQVGGSVRIRGNWWTGEALSWDNDNGNTISFVEQRSRLNVKADFTEQVSAFIELDEYDVWGSEFRSNYITGVDVRGGGVDEIEVYQSYIEASEMWGQPLMVRIGRQEIALGSQWLVGTNDAKSLYTGLSFDGVLVNYATDMVSVSAFDAKLAETSPIEEDGDVDLYGVYASYLGIEDMTIDAYWLYVRDPRGVRNVDLDTTQLHTIGLRGAGTIGAFDLEAEAAYQFGDGEKLPGNPLDLSWDNDATDINAWAGNLEVGYTFDMTYTPRVYLGGAYFGAGDDEDVAFNRLFSNWEYSEFVDVNANLSNAWILRAGVSAMPTEDIELLLAATYLASVEPTKTLQHFWPWNLAELDSELGWELGLYMTYNYSEDLSLEVGYAHFFVGDGMSHDNFHRFVGNFSAMNGYASGVGTCNDDADYLYFETKVCF